MSHDTSHHALGGQQCQDAHHPVADLEIADRQDTRLDGDMVLLVGSQSASSGEKVFPQREFCPVTGARDMQPMSFGPRGKLYSYATIHVSSSRATPYTIGYVDFENGVRVMCHVREAATTDLSCDLDVVTAQDAEGWYVRPVSAEAAQ